MLQQQATCTFCPCINYSRVWCRSHGLGFHGHWHLDKTLYRTPYRTLYAHRQLDHALSGPTPRLSTSCRVEASRLFYPNGNGSSSSGSNTGSNTVATVVKVPTVHQRYFSASRWHNRGSKRGSKRTQAEKKRIARETAAQRAKALVALRRRYKWASPNISDAEAPGMLASLESHLLDSSRRATERFPVVPAALDLQASPNAKPVKKLPPTLNPLDRENEAPPSPAGSGSGSEGPLELDLDSDAGSGLDVDPDISLENDPESDLENPIYDPVDVDDFDYFDEDNLAFGDDVDLDDIDILGPDEGSDVDIPRSHKTRQAPAPGKTYDVLVIDCEMVALKGGEQGLLHITVVDFFTGHIVLRSYVQPGGRVVDWRREFTGFNKEKLARVTRKGKTLHGWEEVRDKIFAMSTTDTIFIGHALANDLRVLRIAADRVVDSQLMLSGAVFGNDAKTFPRNWSLKAACQILLSATVQAGRGAHRSDEDAYAARELVIRCIRQPEKLAAWAADTRAVVERQLEKKRVKEEAKRERQLERNKRKKLQKAEMAAMTPEQREQAVAEKAKLREENERALSEKRNQRKIRERMEREEKMRERRKKREMLDEKELLERLGRKKLKNHEKIYGRREEVPVQDCPRGEGKVRFIEHPIQRETIPSETVARTQSQGNGSE
ncbi:hypothetical protein F4777DRAFT_381580 [Nemania sp. FL0916]|nr:hypothetical protein F4777DRAFT_381580 [Nemania sp. FL0916]